MIRSFRNRGLQKFWESSDVERIPTDWARRIATILDMLDAAGEPEDTFVAGFGFHAYLDERQPRFGLMVSTAWRLSFAWERGDAIDVDLEEVG